MKEDASSPVSEFLEQFVRVKRLPVGSWVDESFAATIRDRREDLVPDAMAEWDTIEATGAATYAIRYEINTDLLETAGSLA